MKTKADRLKEFIQKSVASYNKDLDCCRLNNHLEDIDHIEGKIEGLELALRWHILLNEPWKDGVRLVHAAKYGPAEGQGHFNIFFVGVPK
jgi:hypothetical protein